MVPCQLGSRAPTVTTSNLPDRLVLTVSEAAMALQIGRNQAYAAVQRNEIPSLKIGRRLLIPRMAVQRLLDDRVDALPGQEHDHA